MYKNDLGFSTRILCILLAISIFVVSCNIEKDGIRPSVTSDIQLLSTPVGVNQTLKNSLEEIPVSEFEGLINEVYNLDKLSKDFSKEGAIAHINTIFEDHGVKNAVDMEAVNEILNKYFYVSTSDSYHHFLLSLKNKKEITINEFNLLDDLDKKVTGLTNSDFPKILKFVETFQLDIEKNEILTNEEKLRLSNFAMVYQSSISALNANPDFQKMGDCTDCLKANGVKITFWSSVVFGILIAGCLTIAVPSGGIALYPCLAAVFGASIMTAFAQCWNYCFGDRPFCSDPTCPDGFTFELETAKCCLEQQDIGAFTSGNGTVYVTFPQTSGDCPPGWEWNALFEICAMKLASSWQNVSFSDNKACVDAECSEE